MTVWTMLRCDYRMGERICPHKFRTTLDRSGAEAEAAAYGWTRHTGEIRCPDHAGMDNEFRDEVA